MISETECLQLGTQIKTNDTFAESSVRLEALYSLVITMHSY